jgi:DNA-binding response OmpR family regulator
MTTLSFGPFVMHLDTRRVLRQGVELQLRPQAFQALRVLLLNSGQYAGYERMVVTGAQGQALGELERACHEHSSALHTVHVDPHVDEIRGNTRFERVRGTLRDGATAH